MLMEYLFRNVADLPPESFYHKRDSAMKSLSVENFKVAAFFICCVKSLLYCRAAVSFFDKKISPPPDLLKKLVTKVSQNFETHFKTSVALRSQRQLEKTTFQHCVKFFIAEVTDDNILNMYNFEYSFDSPH